MRFRAVLFALLLLPLLLGASARPARAEEPAPLRPAADLVVSGRQGWQNGDTSRAFDIQRAELGLPWHNGTLDAEIRLESVRSAPPQSLYGTAGNSLIVRLKRVWIGGHLDLGPLTLEGRGGLIGDAWVQGNARLYDLRENGAQLAESPGAFDTSELGLGARLSWQDHAFLLVTVGNGEGRAQVELNRGKNTTAVLGVRPWSAVLADTDCDFHVLGVLRDGSQGVASVRSHRAGLAAVLRLPYVKAGGEWLQAWGLQDDDARTANGYAAWLQGQWQWLGVWARTDHWNGDARLAHAQTDVFGAGVYVETQPHDFGRWRVGLAWQSTRVGADVGPVPGQAGLANDDSVLLRLAWRTGENEP